MSYRYPVVPSDKSRNVAGTLQLLPGFGRMYLGYGALGAMQFALAFCMGVGFAWSWIDGILILSGRVKLDGYGRTLE
jgi:TM2 domain-containing membrane protein YozV